MLVTLCLSLYVRRLPLSFYPFQRVMLAPRDLVTYFSSWTDAASTARSEKEALQRQRIELAQLSTHAAQLSAENEQLRRLLQVADTVTQPSVAVEVLYEPPNGLCASPDFQQGLGKWHSSRYARY
jgi:rod shape-determining protein MreC